MGKTCKRELVELVSERTGVTKATARDVMSELFGAIADELAKGNSVTVSGFGTWRMKVSRPRKVRNPQDGTKIATAPRTRVAFKAGATLRRTAESSIDPEVFFGRGVGCATELGGVFARLFDLDHESLDPDEVTRRIREVLAEGADEEAAEFFAALRRFDASLGDDAFTWPDELADLAGLPRACGGQPD